MGTEEQLVSMKTGTEGVKEGRTRENRYRTT